MNKIRDIVLIVIAAGLLVAILIPAEQPSTPESKPDPGGAKPEAAKTDPAINLDLAPKPIETSCAPPAKGIPHKLLPLVVGSTWVYRVTGPEAYAPKDKWTMRIKSMPTPVAPWIVEVGYGDDLHEAKLWFENDNIWTDGLPLIEPIRYLGNKPTEIEGALMPTAAAMIKGAVWESKYERKITHRYRNDRGKVVEVDAKGIQKDRAEVEAFEDITVPAGQFNAHRIYWLSRFEIKAKGRDILDSLTGEPYRKETMWLVPGIGIVRRKIEYMGVRAGRFSFDLISYTRPE